MNKNDGGYRIFISAFPTVELAERIQAVRVRHDTKTARITAPQVTVVGPYWRNGPATNTWSLAGEMHAARRWHTATLLPSGQVLILEGVEDASGPGTEIYDPSSGTWRGCTRPLWPAHSLWNEGAWRRASARTRLDINRRSPYPHRGGGLAPRWIVFRHSPSHPPASVTCDDWASSHCL